MLGCTQLQGFFFARPALGRARRTFCENLRAMSGLVSVMKAIAIDAPGGPEVMTLHDLPVPEPKAGEALVRLEASGVNFIDVYYRKGHLQGARAIPLILGLEGAGVVERSAPGVTLWPWAIASRTRARRGRTLSMPRAGGARSSTFPMASRLRDAAALMLQGMTAHYLVNSTFPLKAAVALVHAGAGGVGLLADATRESKGATVITTVSTAEKAELSKRAGADHVIDYTREDFAAAARRITGGKGVRRRVRFGRQDDVGEEPRRAAPARLLRALRRIERSRPAIRSCSCSTKKAAFSRPARRSPLRRDAGRRTRSGARANCSKPSSTARSRCGSSTPIRSPMRRARTRISKRARRPENFYLLP
jgi:hypothetical protein